MIGEIGGVTYDLISFPSSHPSAPCSVTIPLILPLPAGPATVLFVVHILASEQPSEHALQPAGRKAAFPRRIP